MSEPAPLLSPTAIEKLREICQWSGRPMAEELERAVTAYHDRAFWDAVNAGYAALRSDPQAWAEEEAERRAWEQTLMDGLDPAERWQEDAGRRHGALGLADAPDEDGRGADQGGDDRRGLHLRRG